MNQLIPVTIVTGFLGSGKTTVLRGLINRRQTSRLALLINEFGEVSIDGALLRGGVDGNDQIRIHDFPYGLIAYGDDELFIPVMRAIAERRAHVDHVLIETSGLALPTAVMEMLQGPGLAGDFILDATLAVVDTPLLLADQFEPDNAAHSPQAAVASLFEQQLEYADVVVLNKIDLLDEKALLLAETRVRQRAPNVRFLELAYHAQLDIRLALGLRLHQPTLVAHNHRYTPMPGPDASPPGNQDRLNGHAHSGLSAHSHGLATHRHFHEQDPGWLSFVLRSQAPQQTETLRSALIEAARAEPILRSKGFIRTRDSERAVLVQGVRSRVVISVDAAKPAVQKSELVFIGYHLSRANIAALLTEMTGTLWK
ncbi:cobalamin biosynthesis-like protein [Sulfuriferula plumbiphila]|uniref:Cobalamin biosynthesis-like protein n=1 Tax=Sulfuriferula plumbiphila TaxID=171865 RepID=A0A512L9W8_9PROT|nr:GTP-binding protein [Sulfuriferula plumbiphila]BBP05231.1 cobalamin biosynthesis-like protein [Sulfuriferula plumbiphila]GEP31280.1 cobalamin biosynthesis-like protein [Sulfuriferula plumbiphila]